MKHVALLNCYHGFVTLNTQGSTSYFPEFLFATDLEIDGTTHNGVYLQAGREFHFVNSDIDSYNAATYCTTCHPFVTAPDSSGSVTSGIYITGTAVHDGPASALYINAQQVTVSGSIIHDTCQAGPSGCAAIGIAPYAQDVLVTGSVVGYRYGNPAHPYYGVVVNSGALQVSLVGNDYSKATTGSVNNGSAYAVSFSGGIGYNGLPISSLTCAAGTTC